MAYECLELALSFPANSDLSAKQFYIGYLTTAGNVAVCNSATAPIGIIQDDPAAAGRACLLGMSGVSRCIVNGADTAIARGDWIAANNDGVGVKNATDKQACIGKALEAASAANAIIAVQVLPVTVDV